MELAKSLKKWTTYYLSKEHPIGRSSGMNVFARSTSPVSAPKSSPSTLDQEEPALISIATI